ncbi:glycosyl transferase family group 2-domain-containing protein [Lipomyces arxii]|uniref:glycosyl transferase family group 2-domain-containing protein n=1 Tax=Lipomyces arxii TaxID=56418 RepID=UPI0034CFF1D2
MSNFFTLKAPIPKPESNDVLQSMIITQLDEDYRQDFFRRTSHAQIEYLSAVNEKFNYEQDDNDDRQRPLVDYPAPSEVLHLSWRSIDRYDIMCHHLYNEILLRNWIDSVLDKENTPCVALRIAHLEMDLVEYRSFPPEANLFDNAYGYTASIAALNVEVAVRLSYPVVTMLLSVIAPHAYDIELDPATRIQVIESYADLRRARKYQYAAFVRSENCLVIWADNIKDVITFAATLEGKMVEVVWQTDIVADGRRRLKAGVYKEDLEAQPDVVDNRPTNVIQALSVALAMLIMFTFYGVFIQTIVYECKADHRYARIAALLYLPPFTLFCAFFCIVVAGVLFQLFGPVSQMRTNSANYSALPPKRISPNDGPLPHITIQCPVYKEGLDAVIRPTMRSLLAAVTTYELQGGTANIFVNDDGLQLISPEEADERRRFYDDHLVGYVARPAPGQNGYVRAGRFKKASNMNYCLNVSNRVEEILEEKSKGLDLEKLDESVEIHMYEDALAQVAKEDPDCWLAGDIRVGDIILIVDSDTRVPEDCLLDAVSEFHSSPNVAILQNTAGVMMVVFNYWEDLIAWFTRLIYFAIQYGTSSGDAAAFVGHNAFLRWSAVQEVATMGEDGKIKYWSESHVSEDFELSLKLRCQGYTIRLAAYHGDQFKEGVSLTVYDEITRWQKYAYGCSELMFKPVRQWYTGMIFTKLFRQFLFASEIRFFAKLTVVAYMGTYYAIAASLLLTVINYFVVGWFAESVDHFYVTSFNNFISACVVFSVASPIAVALVKYRTKQDTFWNAVWDNFRWAILMTLFLGGLSWHLTLALLSHMFSINMTWGATAKELKDSNFFKEFPKIMKSFKYMYIVLLMMIVGIAVLASAVPWNWRISGAYTTLPLGWAVVAHLLSPIALNPQLMTFSF